MEDDEFWDSQSEDRRQHNPRPPPGSQYGGSGAMDPDAPPELWDTYFPGTMPAPGDHRLMIMRVLEKFWLEPQSGVNLENVASTGIANLDFERLERESPVADFGSVLRDDPGTVLGLIAMSLHQACLSSKAYMPPNIRRILPQMLNYGSLTPLRAIKSNFVEKFVAIQGNVVRVGNLKPLITSCTFECGMCGNRILRNFEDGRYDPPAACEGRCKSRYFKPDRSNAASIDWQEIRLQEIVSTRGLDLGRIPRTIECELTNNMVNCCIPGDVITMVGTVKSRRSEAGRGNQKQALFVLYLDVNCVYNSKRLSPHGKLDVMEFCRSREMVGVLDLALQPDVFRLLVHSLVPGIYGHDTVKAGLLLALFGGRTKYGQDRDTIAVRGDPHVLVVGDPGLGKSQMLRSVVNLAPRGVYVCGNTSTSSGLTVTVVRDGKSEYALEAGALVLADQGLCCIDEFDKMGSEHSSLLEAMEQQSVSVAKAGIVCTLAARCSVMAAANPVGGHYDRSKTVAENLRISMPLLSRFDIIFILMDNPDEERDHLISEHVIDLHSGHRASAASPSALGSPWSQASTPSGAPGASPSDWESRERSLKRKRQQKDQAIELSLSAWTDQKPLAQRLALGREQQQSLDIVPTALLRKYVLYAKRYVHPKLSSGARRVLQDFYLKLRRDHRHADATPVTTRQLESMIRLAEARARVELKETVTEQHARDIIDIMKESLYDVLADQFGHVAFDRVTGMSKSKQTRAFIKACHKVAQRDGNDLFTEQDFREIAEALKLKIDHFGQFLDTLNQENYILKRGPKKYVLLSASLA